MRFSLLMPEHATLDDLADEVTHVVWDVITATPPLERLYPGYFVAIHSVVARHLREALTTETLQADGRHCLLFEGIDDVEVFKVKIAGAVVVRLDEVLRQARALDLIHRDIPGAVFRVLRAHVCDSPAAPESAL